MKGDLHLHSYYSDGLYAPEDVMRKAKAAGCEVVALTDHDSFDGVAEATAAAENLGMQNITGAEFSAYADGKVHVLGYGFRRDSERLQAFVRQQKLRRRERAEKILERLHDHGFTIPSEVLASDVGREISRPHIALAMVQLGYERDFMTAMRKWLLSGAPTYVSMPGVAPEVAIEEIHAAGGAAVLAHPVRLDTDAVGKAALVRRLAAAGLDGIEAVYKRSSRAAVKQFKDLARECKLFVTAGADYHGNGNEIIAREIPVQTLQKLQVAP